MDDSAVTYTPVESSNVEAVGYDAPARRLWVKFRAGSTYRYEGVPAETFRGLVAASSKGKYLHAHVIGAGYVGARFR
jgi:hypothetical protein